MVLSSDLQSRSEGSFGRAVASPLRESHPGSGHTRQTRALMTAGGHRLGKCAWMGKNATTEVAAMAFAGATCPSEIRRKRMSRIGRSLSTSPEKLERDKVGYGRASSRQKGRREWMVSSTLSVCLYQLLGRSMVA